MKTRCIKQIQWAILFFRLISNILFLSEEVENFTQQTVRTEDINPGLPGWFELDWALKWSLLRKLRHNVSIPGT